MKVLHVNAGLEEGGAKTHIVSLLNQFPHDEVELMVLQEGSVSKQARLNGIKVHVMNQSSRYDLTIIKKLEEFININHFDVIHTHGARSNLLLALIRKKLSTFWVSTVHSDPELDFMDKGIVGKIFSFLNIKSLKKTDGIIAVTEDLKIKLIKGKISKDKIFVVYNGIDFDVNTFDKITHKLFTMTCIARLHPIKAHQFLFESIKTSGLRDFHLNIIGDGGLREELEKLVAEMNFEKQIHFHGTLEKLEVEKILQQTDLTVLSSISEGFPLVLLESANQKVPFITTDVGDCSKLVPNSTYGWLVPSQDLIAFSSALKEAYSLWEIGTLENKGNNVFKLSSKKYSLNKMYLDTLKVYKGNKITR